MRLISNEVLSLNILDLKKTAHGTPILIGDNKTELLSPINTFLEREIQELVFKHPASLPISDINESYNPIVPIAMELQTGVGPMDIFMATPSGDLLIIETKLWSNPESRRKVVAQILDYATELANWSYSDLQREINKRLGTKGNTLYRLVSEKFPSQTVSEVDFVDAVSRNLRLGRFLLIIAGDGIREGAKNLSEFIGKSGNLNFSLAMIELPVFENSKNERIVFPRTIMKTVEVERIAIDLPEGFSLVKNQENSTSESSASNDTPEKQRIRDLMLSFWSEFIDELEFDDPEQTPPNSTKGQNLFVYPGLDKSSWISCYFMNSTNRVGVYYRFGNSQKAIELKEQLSIYREEIKKELGDEIIWSWDDTTSDGFGVRLELNNVYSDANREEIKVFFNHWLNKIVNVMRPKLKEVNS